MSHPDEGTIHAWLDGALSPEESTAFETRLASDPVLQASVAEARGLIAASSRILGALDAVPGNVTPKERSVREGVASLEAARAHAAQGPASRKWSAQRWAVAATIVAAVGVGVLYKFGDGAMTPADLAMGHAARTESAPVQPPRADDKAVSDRPVLAASPSDGAVIREQERMRASTQPSVAAPARQVADAGTGVGAVSTLKGAAGAGADKDNAPTTTREMLKASAKVASVRDASEPAVASADQLRRKSASVALQAAGENDKKSEKTKTLAAEAGSFAPSAAPASPQSARRAPATAILTETVPDPRASAIGCHTVRFGEWSPTLVGARPPLAAALDSQAVAIGWRRARPLTPAGARAWTSGTWMVQGDSVRLSLPEVGEGLSVRATIGMQSGVGAAAITGADGAVRNRATASWSAVSCVVR